MAAICRLARFGVSLSGHTRHVPVRCNTVYNKCFSHTQLIHNSGLLWCPALSASHRYSTNQSLYPSKGNAEETSQTLRETLNTLDDQAKRGCYVNPYTLNRCFSMLKSLPHLAPDQALSLIRASGMVIQLPVSERHKLFEMVWKNLEDKDVVFDISHYNAVLKLKIRNKDPFKPGEFLSELEEKGLTPNRPTYQLLVDKHCEEGDLDGARELMEVMKSNQVPINRVVYDSLIKGHMKKGDIDGATSVLEDMRGAGMEASGDTYKVLICGYAEQGNIDALRQTLKTAKEEEVFLHPQLLLNVVYTLGAHNQPEAVEEMLREVTETKQRYHGVMQTCMASLVANGNVAEAYQVWQCVQRTSDMPHRSNSFLKTLVMGGNSVDTIVEYIGRLAADGHPCEDMEIVNICAFIMRGPNYYFELLEKLNEKPNYNVKMFTAKIRRDFTFDDEESLYQTVRAIFKVVSSTDNEIRERQLVMLLYQEIWSKLSASGHEADMARFRESGVPESYITQLNILDKLHQGQYEEALEDLREGSDLPLAPLKSFLPESFPKSGYNSEGLIQVLNQLAVNLKQQLSDLNSVVVLNIIESTTSSDTSTVEHLLESLIHQKIQLRANYQTPLHKALKDRGFSKEFISKTDSLFVSSGTRSQQPISPMSMQRMDELKAALSSEASANKAAILRRLAVVCAQDGNLEEALRYKDQMLAEYPEFIAYDFLILPLAILQVKEGKTSDALQTLEDYINHLQRTENQSHMSFKPAQCTELVKLTLEKSSPEKARDMADCLFKLGFIKHDPTIPVLLTQAHLERGDLDGLINTFGHCIKNQILPANYREILMNLIQSEDAARLQKVVDLLTGSLEEAEVMVQLAVCFIACGKVKQARKLLQVPGLRLGQATKAFRNECQNLVAKDKANELVQVVEETKELAGVDRDEILFQLIRLHAKNKDSVKALDVLGMYEDEGISPRPRTKRYLANFLSGEGHPVPFDVPKMSKN